MESFVLVWLLLIIEGLVLLADCPGDLKAIAKGILQSASTAQK
jgi:hypothetical protein